jgi:molybdopterin-containing oxidoreductase family iron-sulfur binding subunit
MRDVPPVSARANGKRLWRTLEEYRDSDAFGEMIKAEFPSLFDLWSVDRRELLRVMGASLAFAGLCGCGPERSDDAVPFVDQPEGYLAGRVEHYATAVLFDGYAQPVLATMSAGRPIKLDGNPDHPAFRGASTPFMQAAILDLYDPDRSQAPLRRGQPASWADFDTGLNRWREAWQANQGAGLRILIGPNSSPTLMRQLDELRRALPQARVHVFDPLLGYGEDPRVAAFGRPLDLRPHLDRADFVVSLDDDLLGPGPMQAMNARAWGERRGEAPRLQLMVAESTPTPTGAKAARRLGIAPSRLPILAAAIAAGVGASSERVELTRAEAEWAKRAAQGLVSNRGRSLLTVGRHCPPALHSLAADLNQRLGNIGQTCELIEPLTYVPEPGGSFLDLLSDIGAGRVTALFVLGANPVYAAPGDLDFPALYQRVPVRVHAGLLVDETARLSTWHLPLPHALEDWSDARSPDGLGTIIQPIVQPLYDTRPIHSLVAALTSLTAAPARDLVRQTWAGQLADDAAWANALKTGYIEMPASAAAGAAAAPLAPPTAPAPRDGEVEILFRPDPTIHDGSFSNNPWLQELPKPLFKTTWENVVALSPALATQLRVKSGDMLRIESGGRAIEGPAWVLPGQPERVITLFLGYGRTRAGKVGTGIGYDAYRLRGAGSPWTTVGTIKPTGARQKLATTQEHHLIGAEGAGLVRTVTPDHLSARREEDRDQESLYASWPEDKAAWGMVIDLDSCIGCNACAVACQAENNVPVVGKEQVHAGREMAWLRVDRYYAGEPDDPETYFEPVPCMHCEQAPCEMGCPVHATVHSPEGLNLMVYNRCIGTRTCSSYCPYKVRRFNWFDYSDAPESVTAQRNPDVTVRGRGVMEKCTYCIQRIAGAEAKADIDNRAVRDGEVRTACQQACPAQAISFGNLADRKSEVAAKRASPRNYALLAELGTRPRTTYLALISDKDENGE